jgi:DNA-binding beta-propeller fold protein YncE
MRVCPLIGILLAFSIQIAQAQQNASEPTTSQSVRVPLKLLQTIPLSGVDGALDHMAIDVQRQRLFVPSEQHSTVEVLDLRTSNRIRTISAAKWPSTAIYHPETNELFVTDRADGTCKVFSGENYELVKSIKLAVGADDAAYDAPSHYIYVSAGGRHSGMSNTLIAIVNAKNGQHLGDISVDSANVQAMAFESSGPKMYADLADGSKIAVIDREKRNVITMWSLTPQCQRPYGLALDSAHHRLSV